VRSRQPELFAERHEAAHAAATAAGPTWRVNALDALRRFLRSIGARSFLAEELKAWAQENARWLPIPPDGRAWGSVILAAKRAGLVEAGGFEIDKFASPKTLWRRGPRA